MILTLRLTGFIRLVGDLELHFLKYLLDKT
ncbi:hypothetical protein NIES932_10100 [Raphidiopsis curvata NIES-932]|nr:hypothetical protein NIES932_10100 [Raphidiopsis curvata NIES-932]